MFAGDRKLCGLVQTSIAFSTQKNEACVCPLQCCAGLSSLEGLCDRKDQIPPSQIHRGGRFEPVMCPWHGRRFKIHTDIESTTWNIVANISCSRQPL